MLELNMRLNWSYKGQVGGESLFHEAISDFSGQLGDWSHAFQSIIGEVLEPSVQSQFETQGGNVGGWAPLAPSTVARKGNTVILTETGELRQSFHTENVGPRSMSWGSLLQRALFHQTGTGKGFQRTSVRTGKGSGRGMPMRKILALTQANKQMMRSIMVRELANKARRTGFAALGSQTDVDPLLARMAGSRLLGL